MSDIDFTFQEEPIDRIEWQQEKVVFVVDGEIILMLNKEGVTSCEGHHIPDKGKSYKLLVGLSVAMNQEL